MLSAWETNQSQQLRLDGHFVHFLSSCTSDSLIAFLPYCHVEPLSGLHSTFWVHTFSTEPSLRIAPRSILIQTNTERTSAGRPQWPCCNWKGQKSDKQKSQSNNHFPGSFTPITGRLMCCCRALIQHFLMSTWDIVLVQPELRRREERNVNVGPLYDSISVHQVKQFCMCTSLHANHYKWAWRPIHIALRPTFWCFANKDDSRPSEPSQDQRAQLLPDTKEVQAAAQSPLRRLS